jgi:hypothetical protein
MRSAGRMIIDRLDSCTDERGVSGAHRPNKQRSIQELIPALAAGLGDQQAAMAGRAVCRPVAASPVWLVIGADRVV